MYDVIGDIHGHARELRQLLEDMGYAAGSGGYRHPSRRALFVGDFIDRGPEIPQVLDLVRAMVESGSALAVMGNHEYNALGYHTLGRDHQPLRPHTAKNTHQHRATLEAFRDAPEAWQDHLRWFYSLPLWLEVDGLRMVHACWEARHMATLRGDSRLTEELLQRASHRDAPEYRALEELLKGKELRLPEGCSFHDKDGHERRDVRVKWWLPAGGMNYRGLSFPENPAAPDVKVPEELARDSGPGYAPDEPPVIFGHYWLSGNVTPLAANVACVDYSVAKGGKLVAYRWNGERRLEVGNFRSVPRASL